MDVAYHDTVPLQHEQLIGDDWPRQERTAAEYDRRNGHVVAAG